MCSIAIYSTLSGFLGLKRCICHTLDVYSHYSSIVKFIASTKEDFLAMQRMTLQETEAPIHQIQCMQEALQRN